MSPTRYWRVGELRKKWEFADNSIRKRVVRGKECCDGGDFDSIAGGVLRDVSALDRGAGGGGVWAAVAVRGWVASVPVAAVGVAGAVSAAVHGQSLQAVVWSALNGGHNGERGGQDRGLRGLGQSWCVLVHAELL